ncbi:Haloacid dehalogenase domain protein hydrolase [mine drainage metagenome]|uniref:Haloacid dehalogenase domain protein hydrolase n=1 Tax=mine drainage metagenome TaxID=410659 RepID=T1AEH4_9ZZZZ
MPYRGVIFDLFGTLIDGWDEVQARESSAELAAALEVPWEPFRELIDTTYTERATGALGDLPEMLRELCRRIGFEPSEAAVERASRLRLAQFLEVLSTPRAETVSLLPTLRDRGIRVGLISDCSSETPRLWPTLAWARPIQVSLFSWSERRRKPAPQLYLSALTRLDLSAAECLYVGDGGSRELSGAEALQIRALRIVHRPVSPGSHFQYDPETDWRGSEISTLSELLPLLEP